MDRYDLRQATFLLAVTCDTLERVRNLKVVLRFLRTSFDAGVHVLEAGPAPVFRDHIAEHLPHIRYDFLPDDSPFFYKTRLLNRLLAACDTDVAVVYDADILCHPANIRRAYALVRQGCDIALPYSGVCLDVPEPVIPRLMGEPRDYPGRGELRVLYPDATGGVVLFRRQSLLAAGGYNEYFKSWGHEDREVLRRMQGLGYRLETVPGHIYHLRHPRQRDSHPERNPHYAANCREYDRVLAMDPDTLRRYAAAFPWRAAGEALP